MDYTYLSDSVLVKLLKAENSVAFREIYNRYWLVLFNTAKRKVYSAEIAEEIIQDIFTDLWERRGKVEIDNLKSYLFGALKFQIFNHIRNQLVQRDYENYSLKTNSIHDCQTENLLAYEDLLTAIESSIMRLPEKTRSIFRLNRLENRSVMEISVQLNIPERTIEYHLTQSLRLLRRELKEFVSLFICSLISLLC
jgi:RNA polymerase sigma-70 factor (family 1)